VAERVQLSRKKGWRMPPNTVSVARPGKWGNPFKVGMTLCTGRRETFEARKFATPADVVAAFRGMLAITDRNYPSAADITAELRGKNLACWCPLDGPCHADVLLELANA
jgi:hypothetical protein